jgi:hypothetical protein
MQDFPLIILIHEHLFVLISEGYNIHALLGQSQIVFALGK